VRIRTFFNYYGGKWRVARQYPEPQHDWICEPFAGGAGYALNYPDRNVLLIEAAEPIAAVWAYLIRVSASEVRSLPLLSVGQSTDDLPGLTQEQRWLIGLWCNPGSATPKKRLGKFHPAWGEDVRERVASQVDRIRHWVVVHGTYRDAPNYGPPMTWFVDPPYQVAGKHYPMGSSKIDFADLAEWCRERRGQTIVCENSGANWLPFEPFATIKAGSGKGKTGYSEEVVWYGGQP
jgi:hypothetical protein